MTEGRKPELREAAEVVARYGMHPASQLLANNQPSGLVAVPAKDLDTLRSALMGPEGQEPKKGDPRKAAAVGVVEAAEAGGECHFCGAETCRGTPHELDCSIGQLKRAFLGSPAPVGEREGPQPAGQTEDALRQTIHAILCRCHSDGMATETFASMATSLLRAMADAWGARESSTGDPRAEAE